MDASMLAALADPTRLRIVELLDEAPRSVGEVVAGVGIRQPQATKHLQVLERAGLVHRHPLGQRRIYALRREPFRALGARFDALAAERTADAALRTYAEAVATEQRLAARDPDWATGRTFQLARELPAPAAEVWKWWTRAEYVRRWWAPDHFEVADAEVEATAGGSLRIVMREGDGTLHASEGRIVACEPPRHLRFELSPRGADGAPLLTAVHDLTLDENRGRTGLLLSTRITAATPGGAPAVAGIEMGWGQLLARLARELSPG